MAETKDKITEKFALGPGKIYVRSGSCTEDETERDENLLGITEDGCTLSYEYKIRELYDMAGEVAGILRFGEKLCLRGKLCRVLSRPASDALTGRVSVLFVCPLPSGESLRLMARGVARGASFAAKAGGAAEFDFLFGRGQKNPSLSIFGDIENESKESAKEAVSAV